MLITRRSPIDGSTNTMDIDVTEEQLANWKAGMVIQNAMPNVSPDDREFILNGITAAQWNSIFGEEDDQNE